jgi:probable rRNA maturation factor
LKLIIIRKAIRGVSRWVLVRFAHRARLAAGLPGRVNIVLVSSSTIRKLNRSFRGKDQATDVLAFPTLPLMRPGSGAVEAHASRLAGEIVISSELAADNARRYGHDTTQELKVLILHGMLHLAGYDHEHDQGKMARKEERVRRELGLTDGLIRRMQTPTEAGSGPRSLFGKRRQPANGQTPKANSRRRRKR